MNTSLEKTIPDRSPPILLICWYDPHGISTVAETVTFMQRLSAYPVTVLNLFEHRLGSGAIALPACVDLRQFAAIIVHNTIAYNVDNLRGLDQVSPCKLRDYCGVKILMKQDENYRFLETARYIGATGFDVVFTCLDADDIAQIYPPHIAGTPQFIRMLTGYVTPKLRALNPFATPRPIDIGYRGSIQPLSFGRLAYEKRKIGSDVLARLSKSDLALDISSRWEDRIGGDQWFVFMQNCKATLGAGSGSSIFDLDGKLEQHCAAAEAALGPLRDDDAYAEAYLAYLAPYERQIDYEQLSPRHFEAAACGTLQLLYPGNYSGIFIPHVHYFPLARDYSNLDDALDLLRDEPRRLAMVRAAHDDIIGRRDYWIEHFVEQIDSVIKEHIQAKGGIALMRIAPGKLSVSRPFFARVLYYGWACMPAWLRKQLLPLARRILALMHRHA